MTHRYFNHTAGTVLRTRSRAPRRLFSAGVLLLLAGILVLAGCGTGDQAQAQRRRAPVPVAVQAVDPGTVAIYATYPGRISGQREVPIRSRIKGILIEDHYNEGEFVEKGELLFTIDPQPFRAAVKQRKAQLKQAKAELDQAQRVWQRISRLYQSNAVSEARYTRALARLETARAALKLARANLKAAQIKLSYTTIESTLPGVTGLQEVDEGALVTSGMVLTTVTELDPVYVRFSMPAEDALMGRQAWNATAREDEQIRTVRLILPSGEFYGKPGMVNFTQSTIDPTTGTVRLRAIFDNDDYTLVPGRFVRVRIRLATLHHAIVIPNKALSDSQRRTRVYVVTEDNKAKPVPVELGPVVADGRVITAGLEPGDRVITIGLGQVRAGAPVAIKPPEAVAIDETTEPAAGGEVVTEPAGGEARVPPDSQVEKSGEGRAESTPAGDQGA